MFKICGYQFRQTFRSPRLYLALLLGCAIQIISAMPLLDFSKAMGKPLGILEAFIYFNCDTYTASCAFLGAVLVIADIPFSSQNETYTLLRVSRRRWVAGKILYLLGICVVYYIILFLAGALFISGNAFFANIWSDPITVLSQNQAQELALAYHVYFPYRHILTLSPLLACGLSFLLSVSYIFMMSLVIFWLNLRISKVLSYLAAAMVHVVGYILAVNFTSNFYQKFSFLSNSLLMYHNISGSVVESSYLTLPQSFAVYAVVVVALSLLILQTIHNYDFRITVGTRQ